MKMKLNLLLKKEGAHDEDINCVSWHPSNNTLVSCSDDCKIKIWELEII
jgi:WD40 repeat protein